MHNYPDNRLRFISELLVMDEELTALDTAIEFVDKTVRKTLIGEDKSVPFQPQLQEHP